MNITDFVLSRLDPDKKVAAFDCGDIDLNNFLSNDAAKYQKARLSVTHILALPVAGQLTEIAGYFCLLTDKLVFDPVDKERKKAWKDFNKKIKSISINIVRPIRLLKSGGWQWQVLLPEKGWQVSDRLHYHYDNEYEQHRMPVYHR